METSNNTKKDWTKPVVVALEIKDLTQQKPGNKKNATNEAGLDGYGPQGS